MSASEGGSYVPNELLSRLVGCRLFSVQFVLDHVQLRFDDDHGSPFVNCDVMPAVEYGGTVWRDGQPGYADALRALIPQTVTSTSERAGAGLRIQFPEGAVVIHPGETELVGPEIALLTGFADGAWMCWRPGEDSFEDLG